MCPIELGEFEKGKEPDAVKGSTVKPAVEKFLAENSDNAYTTREISEAIDANKATVNHTVRKLVEEGKVERRSVSGLIYNRWCGGEPSEE
jgi:predicted transcriptional regulator